MAKQRPPKQAQRIEASASSQKSFETKVQSLLEQQKYRQALEEIQKMRRSQPDISLTPSEAEIWLLRGKQEVQKEEFKPAESSLRHALKLGLGGETYYWLAKCLLSLNRLDAALDLIRPAFEQGSLPKDYSICYPKLLLLKGDIATVQQLVEKQGKRFPAAHLHWLRGVLALKDGQTQTALMAFQKVKKPLTPGDHPDIWQIYSQQALDRPEIASLLLGLERKIEPRFGVRREPSKYDEHPLLQKLALLQKLKTGHPCLTQMPLQVIDRKLFDILPAIKLIESIEENDFYTAGQALLRIDSRSSQWPELVSLRPALLTLAGQQALTQEDLDDTEIFWKPLLTDRAFDPQLAVNLLEVFDANASYQEAQRLLTRLIKWLEQAGKDNPQTWTKARLDLTLAQARCRLADIWMALDRPRTAIGELQQAERICPQSPEVIGRRGLMAALDDNPQEAVQLLTQAIEGGCRHGEVYLRLIDSWKALDNPEAAKEARRRFGKYFDDLSVDTEVQVPPWIDALSTQSYSLFSHLVTAATSPDPALKACQIFVKAVQGSPNNSGRVSLDQKQAVSAWTELLQGLSPEEQVNPLQAIALSLLLFAKREKGIAGLSTQYMLQLFNLGARLAHLVVLCVKERDPDKLASPLRFYLDTMPQPGNALAQIQLQHRRYSPSPILRPFLDTALEREPQNALLLLAKATTYPPSHPDYETFKEKGFELARRLQDAKALQAFREEQALLRAREFHKILPDPTNLDNFDEDDMDAFLESLIRNLVGNKVPPAEFQRMLPELKRMMIETMPDFDDDDDDDDDDEPPFPFGFGFGANPSRSKRPSKRRRR